MTRSTISLRDMAKLSYVTCSLIPVLHLISILKSFVFSVPCLLNCLGRIFLENERFKSSGGERWSRKQKRKQTQEWKYWSWRIKVNSRATQWVTADNLARVLLMKDSKPNLQTLHCRRQNSHNCLIIASQNTLNFWSTSSGELPVSSQIP